MNPLALLSPYRTLIELVAFAALLAGIAYAGHRFLEHEQQIGYDRAVAEYTAKQVEAEKAARAREQSLQQQLENAQNAATQREQTIKTLAAASSAASGSLRDTLGSIRNGVPTATVDALRKTTDTLAAVLSQCQDRYRAVAEAADGHASDVQLLHDAWPK